MIAFNEYGQGYFVFEDVVQDLSERVIAVIKRFKKEEDKSMKKLLVAKHLSDDEYKLFLHVYQLHNRSMGLAERERYTLSHVVKIERANKGKGLKVYYDNGDWWYYSADGTWY